MRHSLPKIAASHFLSRDKLIAFASSEFARNKYHIDGDKSVSTWQIDILVIEFKKTQTREALAADRNAEIIRQQSSCAQSLEYVAT